MTLGLCTQIDLDAEVKKAAARLARDKQASGVQEPAKVETLLPAEETIEISVPPPEPEPAMATSLAQEARDAMAAPEEEEVPDADSIFAKLKELKRD